MPSRCSHHLHLVDQTAVDIQAARRTAPLRHTQERARRTLAPHRCSRRCSQQSAEGPPWAREEDVVATLLHIRLALGMISRLSPSAAVLPHLPHVDRIAEVPLEDARQGCFHHLPRCPVLEEASLLPRRSSPRRMQSALGPPPRQQSGGATSPNQVSRQRAADSLQCQHRASLCGASL